jgi:hypothetical protein
VDDCIRQADQIDICGVVLTTTINKYLSNLRDRLMAGATIRILIIDPRSMALQMAASRSEEVEDTNYYLKKIEATFNDLDYLYRYWQKNQNGGAQKGSLMVRLLAYAPSFGISNFASQTNALANIAFVELFAHHGRYGSSPTFPLTPQQDGDWYNYFMAQFEGMWASGKPWDPQAQLTALSERETPGAGKVSALNFFARKMPDLEERLNQADTVMITGMTLVRTSMSLWQTFKGCLERGTQLRFQLIDPDHKALLEVAANRFNKHQDPAQLRLAVEQALGNFRTLMAQDKAEQLLQVRLFPAAPPYGIWFIDAGTPKAEIWVELYAFQQNPEPAFHLVPGHDGEWFTFFQRQADVMWSKSRPWAPKPDIEGRDQSPS